MTRSTAIRNAPRAGNPRDRRGRAFALLEVILALAILAGATAVLGEVMWQANRRAVAARAETQAQLLAKNVIDEIIAGYADLTAINHQPLAGDCDGPWVYTVAVGASDLLYLVPVEVIVEQDLPPAFHPVSFRLTRWLPDLPEPAPETSAPAAGSSSGSSTSGSGGSAAGGTP